MLYEDLVQASRFCRDQLAATSVAVDAQGASGWPALLAGAAAPDLIASGSVRIASASLVEQLRARGDAALADVPGLLERLDVLQLRTLWLGGQVMVKP